ncbi:MAG: hypothetical protein AB7K36_15625 [Chloroflexota bacterium]
MSSDQQPRPTPAATSTVDGAATASAAERTAATAATATPDINPPATASAPATQKELLCTICNLRACWEAPS